MLRLDGLAALSEDVEDLQEKTGMRRICWVGSGDERI